MPEIALFEFVYVSEAFEWGLLGLSVRLGGYQPQYFPRLHYFARVLDCDVVPIADYVQYVRKHAYPTSDGRHTNGSSYQAETPIKTRNGVLMLGVPVEHTGRPQRINEARVSYERPWHEKHLNIIRDNYRTAPYFSEVFPELQKLLSRRYSSLADLSMASMAWGFSRIFNAPSADATIASIDAMLPHRRIRMRRILPISSTAVAPPDKEAGRDANDWLVDMCRYFGAQEYHFGGTGAACYMDFKRFEDAGITLTQQVWQCTPYKQAHGEFAPNLSIIDLLMNTKPEEARAILHPARA